MGLFDLFKRTRQSVKNEKEELTAFERPSQEQLIKATINVFNNPFSSFVIDTTGNQWKEPIKDDIETLMSGKHRSMDVIQNMLLSCADALQTMKHLQYWWSGSVWIIKTAALISPESAASLMVKILEKDSKFAEWFTYAQLEAAKQLLTIGTIENLNSLEQLLKQPFSMTPVAEVAKAIEIIRTSIQPKAKDTESNVETAQHEHTYPRNSHSLEHIIEEKQLIPYMIGGPNFPKEFEEISFRNNTNVESITVNHDGVHLGFGTGYSQSIPFSEIVDIKWQPILRPEIAVGGWVKIITPNNYVCPELIGYDYRIPTSENIKIYPTDNCLWYNAVYGEDEAKEKDEKVANILNVVRQIIGIEIV